MLVDSGKYTINYINVWRGCVKQLQQYMGLTVTKSIDYLNLLELEWPAITWLLLIEHCTMSKMSNTQKIVCSKLQPNLAFNDHVIQCSLVHRLCF